MKRSTDYHDYVFKKGKFVGKFDQMYKYSKDIPWHQDKSAHLVFSDIDIAVLKQFRYRSICDIGCGLGHFSNRLHKELSSDRGRPKVTGVDISPTAIKKAKSLFPKINFIKGDLLKGRPLVDEYFDLVVLKETLWYVCHNLDRFLKNVINIVRDGKFLYVSQSFPEVEKWVGQEVIDSPETLKEILSQYVKPIYCCVEWDERLFNRPLLHYLGRVKKA